MPIRLVTKEVRYIHELSLTLEHSMPVSSLAVPGLTIGALTLVLSRKHVKQPGAESSALVEPTVRRNKALV